MSLKRPNSCSKHIKQQQQQQNEVYQLQQQEQQQRREATKISEAIMKAIWLESFSRPGKFKAQFCDVATK